MWRHDLCFFNGITDSRRKRVMKKADTVILVVSVGTMFTDTITTTIGAIEGRIAESYPE